MLNVMSSRDSVKNLLIKWHGTHFAHNYSSQSKQDEYSRVKSVPHPLISEILNHLHSCKVTLCLSSTVKIICSSVVLYTRNHEGLCFVAIKTSTRNQPHNTITI